HECYFTVIPARCSACGRSGFTDDPAASQGRCNWWLCHGMDAAREQLTACQQLYPPGGAAAATNSHGSGHGEAYSTSTVPDLRANHDGHCRFALDSAERTRSGLLDGEPGRRIPDPISRLGL